MLYNAKNGCLRLATGEMEYVCFGTGSRILVMLPGLGDGLRTVRGTALPTALLYRKFAGDFTVYMLSRRKVLPRGCTTRDMARDLKEAMDLLGISRADVLGVSMGGMIAQHLAADFPEKVGRLVLVVTAAEPNPILTASVTEWMEQAKRADHRALMESNLRKIYSTEYYRRNRWLVPILGRLTKPRSYERFLIQADACLTHHSLDALGKIQAPVLVIGGERDETLGGEASRQIAGGIAGARCKMYPQWGHGLYEEAPDFNDTVLAFLLEKETEKAAY